jgi:Arc/MetJ-type ribon-helix-helix transcriptional regulator
MYNSGTMNIHARLTGDVEEIIEIMMRRGHAASKTEAIRLALLDYQQHHLKQLEEDELAVKKMQELDKQMESGKRKKISAKEALGKYAKYLR